LDRFLTLFGPLAWPLATLLIALIFRRDVARALGRVGQFKYRDLEVSFREDLHQAEELARSIPAPPPRSSIMLEAETGEAKPLMGQLIGDISPPPPSPPEDREALLKLAARTPREAIEAAWGLVGRALVRVATAHGDLRAPVHANPDLAVRHLVDRGRLAGVEGMLVRLLRTLRDRSARLDQPSPSREEARRFVDLAWKLASRLEDHG
jgi:hypothetical protein